MMKRKNLKWQNHLWWLWNCHKNHNNKSTKNGKKNFFFLISIYQPHMYISFINLSYLNFKYTPNNTYRVYQFYFFFPSICLFNFISHIMIVIKTGYIIYTWIQRPRKMPTTKYIFFVYYHHQHYHQHYNE